MKYAILILGLIVPVLAGDLPKLTDAERLKIREAQLAEAQAVNAELQLTSQCLGAGQRAAGQVRVRRAALDKLIRSLRPKDCGDCTLNEDLMWKRPIVQSEEEETKENQTH